MQYTFTEVNAIYPKQTYRSKRMLKKLHLAEFQIILVDIVLPASVFDGDKEFELLDAMYELNSGIFVSGSSTQTKIMLEVPVDKFSFEYVKQYCHDLVKELSAIDVSFAEIESIAVKYGDAYYGEW